jgi:hypothetical protein
MVARFAGKNSKSKSKAQTTAAAESAATIDLRKSAVITT